MIIRWPESMRINAQRGQNIRELVELRDVLPTFLEAAGIKKPMDMEGESMLTLIKGKKKGWRKVLDLEHSEFYWPENNWTALTDGRFKYIYFATDGDQQLFDLDNDPSEMVNLAEKPQYQEILNSWRQRMVEHLSARGEPWVIDGDLGKHNGILFGPNHPKYAVEQ
jgi:arylsulfatase A-like enzyme